MKDANTSAATAEVKMFDLLQEQTQLQKQSVTHEREFLDIIRMIMNNMPRNP